MNRQNIVVAYSIVKVSNRHHRTKQQYAVKIVRGKNRVSLARLKGMYPSGKDKTIFDESREFQNECGAVALNAIEGMCEREILQPRGCKFKTCLEAMVAFEKEKKRDHHGNAFKIFFADHAIAEVPDMVPDFVDWLMEKYEKKETTVSKKYFAASALFRWLIKNKQWVGVNPFHSGLTDIKFAPAVRYKSIIESSELDRLNDIIRADRKWGRGYMPDRFKELRVCTSIMYYTGLRPSEAMNVVAENIDATRLILTYQRTKRKNKPPDWRRIPIPAQLITFLSQEGRTEGRLVKINKRSMEENMGKAADLARIGGLSLKTFRKDFASRARQAGASRDDVNLYQGREESILEHHYTTDEWFIVEQCRPWIERMFSEKKSLALVNASHSSML